MDIVWKIVILNVCLYAVRGQQSTPQSPTYRAGVVEYQRFVDPLDHEAATAANLNEYISLTIRSSVDILVFPESSLNTIETAIFVPDVEEQVIPCQNTSYGEILHGLSCAAGLGKYVVVNVKEKTQICSDNEQLVCTSYIYNTNVVFDRRGAIISKYRKYNLFGENGITRPPRPIATTFTTDFGVTFGHFICFDLMFDQPALDLVNQGVRDIIFTANWFSELPFLTAVQIQQAWAFANNVNLLAAGGNNPGIGSTGSGIYHAKLGPLVAGIYPNMTRSDFF